MRILNPIVSGSLLVTGSATITGTVSASSFIGDGSGLTGVTSYTDSDTLTYINSLGIISGSSQIAYTNLQDIPSGIVSSSTQLADITIPGDLTISGILTAREFHTEFVSASIVFQSGSTQFGNTIDDTHTFIGTISATTIQNVLSSSAQIDYDSIPNRVTNNNQLTNGAGYTTCTGTLTGTGTSGYISKWNGSTSQTNSVIYDNGTNVGIGTTSPVQKLTVYSGHYVLYDNRYDDWIFQKSRTDTTQNMGFKGHTSGGMSIWANNNERVRIAPSGNVGIGTDSPAEKLHIVGNIVATGDVTAYYSSDERLKENKEVIQNPLDKLDKISGYTFDWKKTPSFGVPKNDVGVIAQEIEEILPQIVTDREDGYKAVRYEKIIPLLIESIKELSNNRKQDQERIDYLEKIIKDNGFTK